MGNKSAVHLGRLSVKARRKKAGSVKAFKEQMAKVRAMRAVDKKKAALSGE